MGYIYPPFKMNTSKHCMENIKPRYEAFSFNCTTAVYDEKI